METAQLDGHQIFQMLRPEQLNLLSAAAEEVTLEAHVQSIPLGAK